MRLRLLMLIPHPDDESLTGLLPLRLKQEYAAEVWVAPVTLGSRQERRAGRWQELRAACGVLGFRLFRPAGLAAGRVGVREIRRVIRRLRPDVIFLPHARDGHPTHQAVHRLGVAALDCRPEKVFHVVETEYWHPLASPNLMIGAGRRNLELLRRALRCHRGELRRNDYAARLAAWLSDNVRRGAERVGGPGAAAPRMAYATLYRFRRRARRRWRPGLRRGLVVSARGSLEPLVSRWTPSAG